MISMKNLDVKLVDQFHENKKMMIKTIIVIVNLVNGQTNSMFMASLFVYFV